MRHGFPQGTRSRRGDLQSGNVGCDLSIASGFLEVSTSDFPSILSDNDAIQDGRLKRQSAAFRADDVDLVVGAGSIEAAVSIEGLPDPNEVRYRLQLGLISRVVYRYRTIEECVLVGIQLSRTGWEQLAVQEAASPIEAVEISDVLPPMGLVSVTLGHSSCRSIDAPEPRRPIATSIPERLHT